MTSRIMDLFREWRALDARNEVEMLSDKESDALAHHMADLGQRMRDIGPKTVSELAAFLYARTIGGEVPCNKEDAKLLLDLIETTPNLAPVTFDLDLASLSVFDIHTIFDLLAVIDETAAAIAAQPRSIAKQGKYGIESMTAGGDFVEAVESAASDWRHRIAEEARRRPVPGNWFHCQQQLALALFATDRPIDVIQIATRFALAQDEERA